VNAKASARLAAQVILTLFINELLSPFVCPSKFLGTKNSDGSCRYSTFRFSHSPELSS